MRWSVSSAFFAHETGHAIFGGIPVFGCEEDAADDFATYLMLRFGHEQSYALIAGAAYSYKKYVQGSQVAVPLAAFQMPTRPAQRFYNLSCTAYGSDATRYGDFVGRISGEKLGATQQVRRSVRLTLQAPLLKGGHDALGFIFDTAVRAGLNRCHLELRCSVTGAPRVGEAITVRPRVGGIDHVVMEPGNPRPSFYRW